MTKINVVVWQYKFVIGYQEISLECNNFNHDNNNSFLLERDDHHKNAIIKMVMVHN